MPGGHLPTSTYGKVNPVQHLGSCLWVQFLYLTQCSRCLLRAADSNGAFPDTNLADAKKTQQPFSLGRVQPGDVCHVFRTCSRCSVGRFLHPPCADKAAGDGVQNKAARESLSQPALRTVGERATNPNQSQKCQHGAAEPQKVHLGNISLTETGPNVYTDIFCNAPSNILSHFYGQNSCNAGVDVKPGYLNAE